MMKRKFGDGRRTDTAMVNEALCKILSQLVVLIHETHELGIDAAFYATSRVRTAIMNIPQQDRMTIESAITSSDDSEGNVSELETLSALASQLDSTIGRWNTARLVVMIIAAIGTVLTIAATYMGLKRTQELGDVRSRIARIEKDVLQAELKDRDLKIADAGKAAGDANRKAAEAGEGTAKALLATEAQRERAAKAEEGLIALRKDADVQRERAAMAEKELLNLKQILAPRRLTGTQRGQFIAVARDLPRGNLTIRCTGGDPEACDFAMDIHDALQRAGWPTTFSEAQIIVRDGTLPRGVTIWLRPDERAPTWVVGLQRLLDSIGITADGFLINSGGPGEIILFIGHKP
jgi:hypothetical protein